MFHAGRVVHQLHLNTVRALNNMVVGQDIAFRIDDNSRSQRTLTHSLRRTAKGTSLTTLATKEAIEEILKWIFVVWSLPAAAAARARVLLNCGLSVDVYHCWLQLLGN